MRFLPILAALAFAMAGALTVEAQDISTPQTANPERTAVLDGLRRFLGDDSLRFVVKTLNVAHADKGALAYTQATTAKGIGGVFLLTSDARGMWKIGWSAGQGTSDCATVGHSFGAAKVLIESYGIKPDALIPDFTDNNYSSLQLQARQHPHDPCAFGLVGDAGEEPDQAASQEGVQPAAVTAGEKMPACEPDADENFPPNAERQAFLRRCTTNKDCAFVVRFFAAQKKRFQSAVPIVWREFRFGSTDIDDFLKPHPFLTKLLDGLEPDTPVFIAESRASTTKKAGVNLLFVVTSGPMYCGTGGCDFSIYADSGAGYEAAANFLEFPVQARVSRTATGGVSVFIPFIHKHAPNSSNSPDGTYFEYTLKGNSLEKTDPHEGC
jgi:hypothetical protein